MGDLYKQLETQPANTRVALKQALDELQYNAAGLIPAIAQDVNSDTVLMLAWMNRTALEQTLATGWVTYYSRSRKQLWRKGETSGHQQRLHTMHLDCDGDAVLVKVEQTGPACHTNRSNCFYLTVDGDMLCVHESQP